MEREMLNSKILIAIIWGVAIGSLLVFIDSLIILKWESQKIIVFLEPTPLLAFIIIALFSFLYLSSSKLGALCGFIAGIVYSILKSFLTHLWPLGVTEWIALPSFYMLAGFIGGLFSFSPDSPLNE